MIDHRNYNKHKDYATIIDINNPEELQEKYEALFANKPNVLFRGLKDKQLPLVTSLDRFSESAGCNVKIIERYFLQEFQRKYCNYSSIMPARDNQIAWWALMQHYGAPTRLLDWTYSFYVATFFALEDIEDYGDAAVWAIKADSLHKYLHSKFPKLGKVIEKDRHLEKVKTFSDFNKNPIVLKMNPYYLHGRLSVQRGCFLLAGNTTEPFIENLIKFYGSEKQLKKYLFKFVIHNRKRYRKEILGNLYKMNISRATLFPGLDGFAASLKTIFYTEINKPLEKFLSNDKLYYRSMQIDK
jgi:hypothetical protein